MPSSSRVNKSPQKVLGRICRRLSGFALLTVLLGQVVWSVPVSTRDALRPELIFETAGLEELKSKLQPDSGMDLGRVKIKNAGQIIRQELHDLLARGYVESTLFTNQDVTAQVLRVDSKTKVLSSTKSGYFWVMYGTGHLEVGGKIFSLEDKVLFFIPEDTPYRFSAANGLLTLVCFSKGMASVSVLKDDGVLQRPGYEPTFKKGASLPLNGAVRQPFSSNGLSVVLCSTGGEPIVLPASDQSRLLFVTGGGGFFQRNGEKSPMNAADVIVLPPAKETVTVSGPGVSFLAFERAALGRRKRTPAYFSGVYVSHPQVPVQAGSVLSGYPDPVGFLNGLIVVRDHLEWGQVKKYLTENEEGISVRMYNTRYESSQWADLKIPAKPDESILYEPLYLLASSQQYVLLKGEGRVWILPQAVLFRESDRLAAKRWRAMVRDIAVAKQEERLGRLKILQELYPAYDGGIEVRVRSDQNNSSIPLMAIPLGDTTKKVNASLPARYQGQVIRIVPEVDDGGHLRLHYYQYEPFVQFRQVNWNQDKLAMALTESEAREELRVIPAAVSPEEFLPIEESRGYRLAEISELTHIPPRVVDRLKRRGFIYQDQFGKVPGMLAAQMAQLSKRLNLVEYPLYALRDDLGVTYTTVRDLVFSHKMAARVIHRPGEQERLTREKALELVLAARLRGWIQSYVGGVVPSRQFKSELNINTQQFDRWIRAIHGVPSYDGYPLWVTLDGERFVTVKGYAGFKKALEEASHRIGKDDVALSRAVQERFRGTVKVQMLGKQQQALRAVLEHGLWHKEIDHPLQAIRPLFVVHRADLPEIWKEMSSSALWRVDQVQRDRFYSLETAAQISGRPRGTLQRFVSTDKKIPVTAIFGMNWIKGSDLIFFLQEYAGLEELEELGQSLARDQAA